MPKPQHEVGVPSLLQAGGAVASASSAADASASPTSSPNDFHDNVDDHAEAGHEKVAQVRQAAERGGQKRGAVIFEGCCSGVLPRSGFGSERGAGAIGSVNVR